MARCLFAYPSASLAKCPTPLHMLPPRGCCLVLFFPHSGMPTPSDHRASSLPRPQGYGVDVEACRDRFGLQDFDTFLEETRWADASLPCL